MKIDLDEIDAQATIHLGLRYGEGRLLTPRQYSKLWEQYKLKHKIEAARTAQICYTIAAFSGRAKKSLKMEDFMPNEKRPAMTALQMKAELSKLLALNNGKRRQYHTY